MRFGVNLSFAIKRWPSPDEWAPFVKYKLGLDYVQFTFDLIDPFWPKERVRTFVRSIKKAVKKYGINIDSCFGGLAYYTYNMLLHPQVEAREVALNWWKRAIDLTSELGVEKMGAPFGAMSVIEYSDSKLKQERYDFLVNSLMRIADYAYSKGIRTILLEPTPIKRELFWDKNSINKVLNDLRFAKSKFSLVFDVGHFLFKPIYGNNSTLSPWIKELKDKIEIIHLQQTNGERDCHWDFSKEGMVNLNNLAIILRKNNLDNVPIFLETFYDFELSDRIVEENMIKSIKRIKTIWDLK